MTTSTTPRLHKRTRHAAAAQAISTQHLDAVATPASCPRCGHHLPPPVAGRVLAAARVIARQPEHQGTSREVAEALHLKHRANATALLRRAEDAQLVERSSVLRHYSASGAGRGARVYVSTAMVAKYADTAPDPEDAHAALHP